MGLGEDDPRGQARFAAFREGLQTLGWAEGRNIRIDIRCATTSDAALMQRFAKELVALQPDLISRPGGNVTGFTNIEPTMASKWLELLKEIAPRVARVAFLFNPATAPYAEYYPGPL
jgi:hypothetical protein